MTLRLQIAPAPFAHRNQDILSVSLHQISGLRDVLADFELQLPNAVARIEAVSIYELDASVTANNAAAAELPPDTLQGRGPKDPISLSVSEGRGPKNTVVRRHLTKNRPSLPQKSLEIPFPGGNPITDQGRRPENRPRDVAWASSAPGSTTPVTGTAVMFIG